MTAKPFSASVIIEWYNATRAGACRSHQAIRAVVSQIESVTANCPDLAGNIEIILTFDSSRLSAEQILFNVRRALARALSCELKIVPVSSGTYCTQKNRGAQASAGDILIFLDSDVIPQPGWLIAVLESFRDSQINAIVGNTFVDYADNRIYSKAFALTWMFPRQCDDDQITPAGHFYANNFAVRRQVFLDNPFRDVPGFMHAAAPRFVADLKANGVILWAVPRAQASHPPPRGFKHYAMRALATGRARALNPDATERILGRVFTDIRLVAYHCKTIIADRQSVALPLLQAPFAIAISASYDLLVTTGFLLAKLFPGYMRKRLDL